MGGRDTPVMSPHVEKKSLTSHEFAIMKDIIKNLGKKIKTLEVDARDQQKKIMEKDELIKRYKKMAMRVPGR